MSILLSSGSKYSSVEQSQPSQPLTPTDGFVQHDQERDSPSSSMHSQCKKWYKMLWRDTLPLPTSYRRFQVKLAGQRPVTTQQSAPLPASFSLATPLVSPITPDGVAIVFIAPVTNPPISPLSFKETSLCIAFGSQLSPTTSSITISGFRSAANVCDRHKKQLCFGCCWSS
ncbi:hypothetical protein DM01DRAFT_1074056 [Hesseltinella vesiculosa]|uniref:Uncharacterized protein n=1 Tax=Hesseltinella vesiculosa TaxID=101127 RepID=A0A1X2GVX3_9FUNG|nr:hypothetical protein DM01DRAFT_1074056 [Hesseltinella vesiculosa]